MFPSDSALQGDERKRDTDPNVEFWKFVGPNFRISTNVIKGV